MNFIGKLDERYEGKLKKDNVLMARKHRKIFRNPINGFWMCLSDSHS